LEANPPFHVSVYLAITGIKYPRDGEHNSPVFYISVYTALTGLGLVIETVRWFIQYSGSIRASRVLYKRLLESVLFANMRFHETISRGRLLNRFGKDFESSLVYFRFQINSNVERLLPILAIDFSLSISLNQGITSVLSGIVTIITISYVGGLPFMFAVFVLGIVYWNGRD
jgi:hypothetical protein